MNLRREVTKIIQGIAVTEKLPEILDDNVDLSKDYMFDSLMIVEMIVKIEEVLSIEFDFEDLDAEKIYKFGELIHIIEKQFG